jgi:TPR repeat protein
VELPEPPPGLKDRILRSARSWAFLLSRQQLEDVMVQYRQAAEAGDIGAAARLGRLYQVADDTEAAAYWYTRAAGGGDIEAARDLAYLLEREGKLDEAESWWQRAPRLATRRRQSATPRSFRARVATA